MAALPDDAGLARLAGKVGLFGTRWIGASVELPPMEEVRRVIDSGLRAAGSADSQERTLLLVERGFFLVYREGRLDEQVERAVREAEAAAERLDDPDLLSAALDLVMSWEQARGRPGAARRATLRRHELVPRMTDIKEIGDSLAMVAGTAQFVGRYAEAEAGATACIERARGIDSGSYMHGLSWRVVSRFMLGDWDRALADQAELERLVALDPRDLPPGFTMRAYSSAALCHELRGGRDEADAYLELVRKHLATRVGLAFGRAPAAARALVHRGSYAEAAELCRFEPQTHAAGPSIEVLCELVAERGAWDEAVGTLAAARAEAAVGEQVSLPLFADRLEGRIAAAGGDLTAAAELLRRSADGFAGLGARWEEAWSRLLLAEMLTDGREQEAELALSVFERLGSVREAERAATLLAGVRR